MDKYHTCVYQIDIVKWLSGGCTCTVQPGRDDTRVFPIWVVMNFKFVTLIWVVAIFPNMATDRVTGAVSVKK